MATKITSRNEDPRRDSNCVIVHHEQGDTTNRSLFPAGSVFASPNLGSGSVSVYIPKGISLTITAVNYLNGPTDLLSPRMKTGDSGSIPLCLVPVGKTVSGLGLGLVGPQELALEQVMDQCEIYVIGSVTPAAYEYKSNGKRRIHQEPEVWSKTAIVETKTTAKKRKLSNDNRSSDSSSLVQVQVPIVEQNQEQQQSDEPSNDVTPNKDDNASSRAEKLSKRQRRKLAKEKAKELASAVALLNKHESKAKSSVNHEMKTDSKSPLTRERRLPSGVLVRDIMVGTGAPVKLGRKVSILYQGSFPNGKVFDRKKRKNDPLTFRQGTGEVIKGLEKGIEGMKLGGEREITIPPEQGYGKKGSGSVVPPNSTLVFSVQLIGLGG